MREPEPAPAALPASVGAGGTTARHRLLSLAALVIAVQALYLFEYVVRLPFIYGPIVDSVVYLHQARALLRGEFGDPSFIAFPPIYGWFLAIFDGGRSPVLAAATQLGIGCASIFMVYRIVAKQSGVDAATASVLLYLGYGTLLFYESKLVPDTLGLALGLAASTVYFSSNFAAGRLRYAAGCGALVGLSALTCPNLIYSAPPFVAIALLPWQRGSDAPRIGIRLRRALGLGLGVVAVLGVNGLWNFSHSGLFVPLIRASNYARANSATGAIDALTQDGSTSIDAMKIVGAAALEMASVREGHYETSTSTMLPEIHFGAWLRGCPSKLASTFSDREITAHEYQYYGERGEVRMLNLLPVTFGALLLLGALGAFAHARRHGAAALWPFLPGLLGAIATSTLYHPSSRHRLPVALAMLLLAGEGLVSIAAIADRRRRILVATAVTLACGVLAIRTLTYQRSMPLLWEIRCAQASIEAGDIWEANRRNRRMCALAPNDEAVLLHLKLVMRMPHGCADVPRGEL